ncbi:hypothetical protein SAMN05216238_102342 [Lentibacillus persicus]|uniref:DUF945 family protein n=1 Tax=Lentibacillus persicus TaxID=640948 RepID=A0A1I1TLT9_9BACI|nr:DUF6583 family protein [Lentibacillus persicus]SFD59612.1 hypothetical protein SAMN05216238_102342 [Lentibacillus persicus]
MEQNTTKKRMPKTLIAIIVAAVLVIGGSAAAFALITGSPKAQYFQAEKNTIEFLTDSVKERYQPEMDWREHSMENPTENAVELSAEYNGPPSSGMGMGPEQILNNSTIAFTSQVDQDNHQMNADLQMNFAGIEINDIGMYLDSDKARLQLPFLDEALQITDENLGPLLQDADPSLSEIKIDFEAIFNQMEGTLPEEDREYIADEYLSMIYSELPDDAFTEEQEKVTVQEQSIDTTKITLNLSEQQLKALITTVLEKMKNDDDLKEIIEEQIRMQQYGVFASDSLPNDMENDVTAAMDDFDQSIDDAISGLEDYQIPEGLTSTIWVQDNLIVKREFSTSLAPAEETLTTLTISGNQLLTNEEQNLSYEFTADDDSTVTVDANLSNKENQLEDSITIAADGIELSYNGSSQLQDGTREFERVFSFSSPDPNGSGSLNWSGEATYENDQKRADHTLAVDMPDLPQEFVSLNIKNDAKTINEVTQPDDSNVKQLGDMSAQEVETYFQTEFAQQFQQWFMGMMGAPGGNMNNF